MFLKIVEVCQGNGLEIHIEDNGTQFHSFIIGEINFVSLSPKLRNSIPVPGSYAKEIDRYVTEADKKLHVKNYRNITSLKNWIII